MLLGRERNKLGWNGEGGGFHPPYSLLNPVENVWAYLRANKLAITVFDTYDDIVDACCNAWNFFANDPEAIASITSRVWAEVSR